MRNGFEKERTNHDDESRLHRNHDAAVKRTNKSHFVLCFFFSKTCLLFLVFCHDICRLRMWNVAVCLGNDGRIRTDRDDWTGGSHSHIWSDVFYLYRKEIDGVLLFHSCGSVCRSKSDGMRSYDAVMKSQGRRDGVGCDDDCGDGEKMA